MVTTRDWGLGVWGKGFYCSRVFDLGFRVLKGFFFGGGGLGVLGLSRCSC